METEMKQVSTTELYAKVAGLAFLTSAAAMAGVYVVPLVFAGVDKVVNKFRTGWPKKKTEKE